ncbi:hypothetical protein RchiOBHm_Chr6g0273341 [Rosa chinensis]|uniref:Uncharacterized protein n=1 Tax=Rosa chinensis TaxID=74649 RepID=A0A2P6PRI1_ROSCH|nr:hypothetical protein RchiOBHm_Chr6g0273341 [Rosa chinensis]
MELDEVSKVGNEAKFGRTLHIQCAGFEDVVGEHIEEAHAWLGLFFFEWFWSFIGF